MDVSLFSSALCHFDVVTQEHNVCCVYGETTFGPLFSYHRGLKCPASSSG